MTSKYAGLPDIDSAPDVYETPDLPPDSTYTIDSDSDSDSQYNSRTAASPTTLRRLATQQQQQQGPGNDNIDGDRLNTIEARKRFGQSGFPAKIEKQHDARRRRMPATSTYEMRTSAGAGHGDAASETPLERLRRLRSEVTELEDQVRGDQLQQQQQQQEREGAILDSKVAVEAGVPSKGKERAAREVTPQVLLQQLQMLRGDLTALNLDKDGESSEAGLRTLTSGGSSAELIEKLGKPSPEPAEASAAAAQPASGPSTAREPASEAALEKRLADLERLIGANEADVEENLPTPLLPSIARMSHLLTLLTQPRHLDSISRRVKVLVSDLERLHESRRKLGDSRPLNVAIGSNLGASATMMTVAVPGPDGKLPSLAASTTARPASGSGSGGGGGAQPGSEPTLSPDALQRIDSLFALLPRLDPLLPLTPRLLSRLRSLATLHAASASFKDDLERLKAELGRVGESEQGLRETLSGLEHSLKENEVTMKGNLLGLEKRVSSVLLRMDQLK